MFHFFWLRGMLSFENHQLQATRKRPQIVGNEYIWKKVYFFCSIVCYCCFVDRLGLTLRLVKLADKRRWSKNGALPRYQHLTSTNNQPHTGIWSSTVQLSSYRYSLKQHRVNDINTNNQPMRSSTVRASSSSCTRHYLICVMKNNKNTGTGKLGKLYSRKKGSRRKRKSQNETENSNTSYLAIITEK